MAHEDCSKQSRNHNVTKTHPKYRFNIYFINIEKFAVQLTKSSLHYKSLRLEFNLPIIAEFYILRVKFGRKLAEVIRLYNRLNIQCKISQAFHLCGLHRLTGSSYTTQ